MNPLVKKKISTQIQHVLQNNLFIYLFLNIYIYSNIYVKHIFQTGELIELFCSRLNQN